MCTFTFEVFFEKAFHCCLNDHCFCSCHAIYLPTSTLILLSLSLPLFPSFLPSFPSSHPSSHPPSLFPSLSLSLPLSFPPTEAEGLDSSESSFEEELPPVSKLKLQTRHSMLDNLDQHINKQQQQTADEPPAKRLKREEENEVCRSACELGVERKGGGERV